MTTEVCYFMYVSILEVSRGGSSYIFYILFVVVQVLCVLLLRWRGSDGGLSFKIWTAGINLSSICAYHSLPDSLWCRLTSRCHPILAVAFRLLLLGPVLVHAQFVLLLIVLHMAFAFVLAADLATRM